MLFACLQPRHRISVQAKRQRPGKDAEADLPEEGCNPARGSGMVVWYSGRRQTGRVLSDDGVEMTIPVGGAMNRNVVPLTPSGLMHGTRVRCMPVRRNDSWHCISVRPSETVQHGLTVGVDKQGGSSEDQSHLSAADVADMGFLIGILDGHCGGASSAHVAKRFPAILHDVYNYELSQKGRQP